MLGAMDLRRPVRAACPAGTSHSRGEKSYQPGRRAVAGGFGVAICYESVYPNQLEEQVLRFVGLALEA